MELKEIDHIYTDREITTIVDDFFDSPTNEKYYIFDSNDVIIGQQNLRELALKEDTIRLFFQLNNINRFLSGTTTSPNAKTPQLSDFKKKERERSKIYNKLQSLLGTTKTGNDKAKLLKSDFTANLDNEKIEIIFNGLKGYIKPYEKYIIEYAFNGTSTPKNFSRLEYENGMTDALMCYLFYEIITSKLKLGEMHWSPAYRLKIKNPDSKRERYSKNKNKKPSKSYIIDDILEQF